MKLQREQTKNGWRVTLTQYSTDYVGEGKTLKQAMQQAFSLIKQPEFEVVDLSDQNCIYPF